MNLKTVLLFTGINFIYVCLGVCKDIFRNKAPRKWSAIISTITYTYYVLVLKAIVDIPTEVAIVGTAISNFLGDYIGRTICEKILPRGIVCYRFTICKDREDIKVINNYLESNNFGYKWEEAHSLHKEYLSYQIYTKNKEQDKSIEALIVLHKIKQYNRTETKNSINGEVEENEQIHQEN